MSGFEDASQQVTVTAGQTTQATMTLNPVQQTPTTGAISISSVPTGATVFLDGVTTGQVTSTTLTGITPGSHTVVVKMSGFEDAGQQVTVTAGQTTQATLTLNPVQQTPTTGAISISSVPTGATVFLDGVTTGQVTSTTLTGITPGSHTVVVKMSGFEDASQQVTVTAGQTSQATLTLNPVQQTPTTGAISVSSVPTGATIFLDGVTTGQVTSTTLTGITPGSHTVVVKMSGYADARQQVTVTAGQTTQATLTLIPTMPVPTGPTGQVYFSTTPQGARIFIDGALVNKVTPTIMAVPVGTHQAVFKLAGYNDLQAGFVAQTNSMTSVSRRLSPGSSVIIPIPPGVPVVTPITTVPTVAPGTRPIWPFAITWPSWVRHYLPPW